MATIVGALRIDTSGVKTTPPLATHRTGEAGAKRRRLMGSDGEMLDVPDDAEEAATFAGDEEERAASADADEPAAPKTETELRYEAEAAYEARVWPDALPGAAVASGSSTGASIEFELQLTKEEREGSYAEQLPREGRKVDRNTLVYLGARAPPLPACSHAAAQAAAALAGVSSSLLDVTAEVRPLLEADSRVRSDAIKLSVRVQPTDKARNLEPGEGVPGMQGVVAALVRARSAQDGAGSAGREAAADAKLARGICLPPRALRMGGVELRARLLDALETEGTSAALPAPPTGLASAVCLSSYQLESVAMMLARERSAYALEDLFETIASERVAFTTLPAGGVTLASQPRRRIGEGHRGGLLAEEMGMGKTVEVLACVLSNPAPPEWRLQGSRRRDETLVLIPPVLVGQWRDEIRSKSPGLTVMEWSAYHGRGCRPILTGSAAAAATGSRAARQLSVHSFFSKGGERGGSAGHTEQPPPLSSPPPLAAIVLVTYAEAAAAAAQGLEWWRVVCDEPHSALTAAPRKGFIDAAAAVSACADLDAGRRWALTGTPLDAMKSDALFDLFGTLCFLRLIGARDTGRSGAVGVLPALHYRNELSGGGRWRSMHNDAAEAIVSMLKPLTIRHTKSQMREGEVLLTLPPCTFSSILVEPASWETRAYEAAVEVARQVRQNDLHRVHAHEQCLRGLLATCSGLVGELGARALRSRNLGLMDRSLSKLGELTKRLMSEGRLPSHRDDFRIGADEVPNDVLALWQDSLAPLEQHDELACAACLRKIARPTALHKCGHLMCAGCAEDLLATCSEARGDTEWREALGIRFSGHGAFPPACLSAQAETARQAKEAARQHLIELVHDTLQGHVRREEIDLEVSTVFTEQAYAILHLRTRELEHLAAEALNTAKEPLFAGCARMSVGRQRVPHLTCPCPEVGCGVRFARADLLDLERHLRDHPPGQRWEPSVRQFVVASALRARNARKAARKVQVAESKVATRAAAAEAAGVPAEREKAEVAEEPEAVAIRHAAEQQQQQEQQEQQEQQQVTAAAGAAAKALPEHVTPAKPGHEAVTNEAKAQHAPEEEDRPKRRIEKRRRIAAEEEDRAFNNEAKAKHAAGEEDRAFNRAVDEIIKARLGSAWLTRAAIVAEDAAAIVAEDAAGAAADEESDEMEVEEVEEDDEEAVRICDLVAERVEATERVALEAQVEELSAEVAALRERVGGGAFDAGLLFGFAQQQQQLEQLRAKQVQQAGQHHLQRLLRAQQAAAAEKAAAEKAAAEKAAAEKAAAEKAVAEKAAAEKAAAEKAAAEKAAAEESEPVLVSRKFSAAAKVVAAAAARGERSVVFVDHPLLIQPTLEAIRAQRVHGQLLRAIGLKSSTKRATREEAVARLGRPLENAGAGGESGAGEAGGKSGVGGVTALVLTLRIGATGLNLDAASQIVFVSPCLDASLRKQAVARCYRMGQRRAVNVTTLAMAGTVEEDTLTILERDDLPPRYTANGTEVTDQNTLRLWALAEHAISSRGVDVGLDAAARERSIAC